MILQALVHYYEAMADAGRIARPGWGTSKVSCALVLDAAGTLVQAVSLKTPVQMGKKEVLRPQEMNVPLPEKRSANIAPNFLCDNAGYFLGLDTKGKPERAKSCFLASKALHLSLLGTVESPAAQAICRFFERWEPDNAADAPVLADVKDDLLAGGNLIFEFENRYAQDDPALRAAWQAHYDTGDMGGDIHQCLVTGRQETAAVLHPSIKNVQGAQSSGASLVSFNAPAFESYGCDGAQGLNAPVSRYAAFAYGTALNVLLSDRSRVQHVGDTTVLCWAEDTNPAVQDLMAYCGFGAPPGTIQDKDLIEWSANVTRGRPLNWDAIPLNPENPVYLLGLAPNAARISVRFFIRDSLRGTIEKLRAHYDRLAIADGTGEVPRAPWLPALLRETVNPNAKDKAASPQLSGDTLRAILTDTMYPATLYNAIQLRIRADHEINRIRIAAIKAYLLKNPVQTRSQEYKEVLTVELNDESTYLPYVLGRMFCVLENIQWATNPNLNATIRDKYFSAACAAPDTTFPTLVNLAGKHMKKLRGTNMGAAINLQKRQTELFNRITEDYPKRLSLHDQGIFQIGYYHERMHKNGSNDTKQEGNENE